MAISETRAKVINSQTDTTKSERITWLYYMSVWRPLGWQTPGQHCRHLRPLVLSPRPGMF